MKPSESPTSGPVNDFALFEQLYPKLRRFAAVVADLDMDPDDLVQDALAATLRRHDLHELEYPAAYLKQAIVRSVSSNRKRASRLRALLPKLVSVDQGSDHYPSDLAYLDELKPLDRAIVYLADIDGLSHEFIAQELGLTSAAVRKRASRARKQLRVLLGAHLTSIPGEEL